MGKYNYSDLAARQGTAMQRRFLTPFLLPVAAFAAAIALGSMALMLPVCQNAEVRLVDALFIATSAVCVTGLSPLDVFASFNRGGQCVVLLLMQAGGLGILTFTTLLAYAVGRSITYTDRVAMEQALFYNPEFSLPSFIARIIILAGCIEAAGACAIHAIGKTGIFNAVFLSVSAFCNAGFAPWADGMECFRQAYAFNFVVMALVVLGGLGFFVLDELLAWARWRLRHGRTGGFKMSFYSKLVLRTTGWLLLAGFIVIFGMGCLNPSFREFTLAERIWTALFESVTCRTAGFSNVNQACFSSATLFFVVFLMFIGGSPCSCAGGIKTTTFRVLAAQLLGMLLGRSQAVVAGRGISQATGARALAIFAGSICLIFLGSFMLAALEQGAVPHQDTPPFFDLFFETASAFCTVGLSVNLTPRLCDASKIVLCFLMFAGKMGPIWLISLLAQLHKPLKFRYPEENIPVG